MQIPATSPQPQGAITANVPGSYLWWLNSATVLHVNPGPEATLYVKAIPM